MRQDAAFISTSLIIYHALGKVVLFYFMYSCYIYYWKNIKKNPLKLKAHKNSQNFRKVSFITQSYRLNDVAKILPRSIFNFRLSDTYFQEKVIMLFTACVWTLYTFIRNLAVIIICNSHSVTLIYKKKL